MKPRRLPYLITELLCLLCFALLIFPMGEKYHLYPSESQPALGLLCLGEYLLALGMLYLLCPRPGGRRRWQVAAAALLTSVSCHLILSLFRLVGYRRTMLELGFSDDPAPGHRFALCAAFVLLSTAGLALWCVLQRRRTRPAAPEQGLTPEHSE